MSGFQTVYFKRKAPSMRLRKGSDDLGSLVRLFSSDFFVFQKFNFGDGMDNELFSDKFLHQSYHQGYSVSDRSFSRFYQLSCFVNIRNNRSYDLLFPYTWSCLLGILTGRFHISSTNQTYTMLQTCLSMLWNTRHHQQILRFLNVVVIVVICLRQRPHYAWKVWKT